MKNKNYRIIGEYDIKIYLIDLAIKIQRIESDRSNIIVIYVVRIHQSTSSGEFKEEKIVVSCCLSLEIICTLDEDECSVASASSCTYASKKIRSISCK